MESSKERDVKLAAARKKLKKFKTQKGGKPDDSGGLSNHDPATDNGIVSDSSAVESLLQLSNQLNGLLDDSANPDRSVTNGSAGYTTSENGVAVSPKGRRSPIGGTGTTASEETLRQRNRDLADRVKQLQQKNMHLTRQMQIQAEHLAELEKQLNTSESESTEKAKHDLQQTREQLQVHIQTIGILVEEKQTLQKQLSNSQKHSQQKSDEIEEYTSRLKASRLRVAELEKHLAVSNTQRARAETTSGDNSKQLEKLKHDLYSKSRDLDDVLEQRVQLEKQLQSKLSANAELEASMSDLQGKLEMSQAYVQQLNNGEAVATRPDLYAEQIEELKGQNSRLHETVAQLEGSLQRALTDRNQTIEQYNQIITSLQHETQQLHSDLESSHKEVTSLQHQLQDFQLENSSLQRSIDELQSAPTPPAADDTPVATAGVGGEQTPAPPVTRSYSDEQVHQVLHQYEQLRAQYEVYAKNYETVSSDNRHLSRLLEEKEVTLSQLESKMGDIQDDKDNSRRLLETVEGDKSALSRALSQNKQLKTQLEELETRFIKITEDNMNTLTSLQREEHVNKELSNRLGEVEEHYQTTSQQLMQAQSFISEHEQQLDHISKMSHQQEQLADRIRHYEAQIQVLGTLQRELHSSQETVRALTVQNSQLREMIIQRGSSQQDSESDDVTSSSIATDTADSATPSSQPSSHEQAETIRQLTTAIHQLEAEREHLHNRCEETLVENNKLSNQLLSQREPSADPDGRMTRQQYETLQNALDCLQDKHSVVMRSKAELLDRSELLEYENMQLQAESETINEYITLYHHQRSVMKVRAEEKDRYIQQLAEDRERVGVKLAELQGLVVRLLRERQFLQSYTAGSSAAAGQEGAGGAAAAKSTDWPDYDTDSDASQVDPIASQSSQSVESADDVSMDTTPANQPPPLLDLSQDFIEGGERVPGVTAQRILTLLSEIGNTNKIDRDGNISHILHCSHCSGPVVTM